MGRKVIKVGKKQRQAVIEVHGRLNIPELDSFFSVAQWGFCRICHRHQDLRCGSCFKCSPRVAGQKIAGGHEFWDSKNPSNRWKVMDQ